MWKSLNSRSSLVKNLGKKLLSLQNSASISPQLQVFNYNSKGFKSWSNCSDLLIGLKPRNFNVRFLSHSSSISENHSSKGEGEVESEEIGSEWLKILEIREEFDGNEQISGTHMSDVSSGVGLEGEIDGNEEISGAHMSDVSSGVGLDGEVDGNEANDVETSKDLEFRVEFDGNEQISGAHMSDVSSGVGLEGEIDGNEANDSVEMLSAEGINVEKLENVVSLLKDSVESRLDDLELSLSEVFMVRVIKTPFIPEKCLIRFFKWASSKEEFEVGTRRKVLYTLARVICMYRRSEGVYALWDLVKQVGGGESGTVGVEVLNLLISTFSNMDNAKVVFEVFAKFRELGCVPNVDTYNLTLAALCKRSFVKYAAVVCRKMLDAGMLPEHEKLGAIISFHCKGLRLNEALDFYVAAKRKNMYPPQTAVNELINCLSSVDEMIPLAKEMLDDIPSESRKHAIRPFSRVICSLFRTNDIEGGKKLLLETVDRGPPPEKVFNLVIHTLSMTGEPGDAMEILKLMESRGLKPGTLVYNVIIGWYAKRGSMEEACKVLLDVRKFHPEFCPAAFHSIIQGYCKCGRYDKAVKLVSDMSKYGVEANVDEYNKLIQSLVLQALDRETSEKLLEEMKSKGMHLPGISLGLISALKELEQERQEKYAFLKGVGRRQPLVNKMEAERFQVEKYGEKITAPIHSPHPR